MSDSQPIQADEPQRPSALEIVRWMADRNPAFLELGIEIVAAERGRTRLAMAITPEFANTFDVMQGGLVFTLADLCFGFTANAAQNIRGVSASAEIHWVAPGLIGDRLVAEAVEVWREGRNGLYDVRLWNEANGDTVALVRGKTRFIGGAVIDD
ncbi:MAG: hotdog fold thioesterase [Pseudomonadota bacterium]